MSRIPGGGAPQLPNPNAHSTQSQFLETRRQLAQLQTDVRVLNASVVLIELTANQRQDLFDPSGLGRAGLLYAGWAISNGNNDTTNLTAVVPAGLTPIVKTR